MSESQGTSAGWKIAPFGKGRNAIKSKHTNELVDALNILGKINIKWGDTDKVYYADNGLTLQLSRDGGGGGIGAGWKWANPRKYDKTKSYKKETVVVVIPTASIVTTGAIDHEFSDTIKAVPGYYVALQSVSPVNVGTVETPSYEYHVPTWPQFAPDDPDDTDNYWQLIAPYPSTVAACVDGVAVDKIASIAAKPVYT